MTALVALDPGTSLTGYVVMDDRAVLRSGVLANELALDWLRSCIEAPEATLAIEMIASYGMPVGKETFETVLWIGRYLETWVSRGGRVRLVYRRDVKSHLCGSMKAKDPHVRQALLDLYGPGKDVAIGKKASPGPLYGVSSHAWSALAVGVTAQAGLGQEVAA